MTEVRIDAIEPGFAVAALRGTHDVSTAPDLRERLAELIESGTSIVVDLSSATFVDSSVLAVLVGAHKVAAGCGLGFAVVVDAATAAGVRRAFEVTGLLSLFWVASDRAAAIDAARRTARLN